MKHAALLAIPLALAFGIPVEAHQATSNSSQPPPAQAASSKPAETVPLTPPQSAELHGDVLMARKEFSAAISAYQQALAVAPTNAAVLNKVGVAYQQLGDLGHSGRFYKKAMKADKNFASPINNLGTVEYEKKHYGKAINLYKKAVVLKVDLSTIYSNLGYAYFANKEYPEAIDAFGKALALDPTVFEHHGGFGSIIQQRSSPDQALLHFYVAKSFASAGDVERTAHYLKLARDEGYANVRSAETDPAFAKVIKDPRIQEVLQFAAPYVDDAKKSNPH